MCTAYSISLFSDQIALVRIGLIKKWHIGLSLMRAQRGAILWGFH
jgi:hypothetical protein